MSDTINEDSRDYLSARAAAGMLGVKLATLYAYTSRGLVESIPGERGRARLYRRRDIDRLKARRDARAGHGPVAAAALRFGEPVLDSAITAISLEEGPVYRGRSALGLASRGVAFEAVAELLWSERDVESGSFEELASLWRADTLGLPLSGLQSLLPPRPPPLAALAAVVPLLASRDPGRFAERPEAVIPRVRTLIRRMVASLALSREPSEVADAVRASLQAESVAGGIAAALGSDGSREAVAALNRALVVGADHELNASTFAARVTASTGADVYACVGSALAGLSGPRHGGATDRVEALVAEIDGPEAAERVVHERQRRGEMIDGFGHPLYPHVDPRGAMLVALGHELAPQDEASRACLALIEAMERNGAGAPTIDVGLVVLTLALGMPRGAAVGIFAIARSVGWVAHALEQYQAGYLVRPRARYLGPPD